ncbi:hypothetical protein [Enterococcus sp. DIV0756]|uniref:hypothetical protein n=1 Tax=Enterococcus sp. DIV0756 TaxID=2774636 RepID=UPI003F683E26
MALVLFLKNRRSRRSGTRLHQRSQNQNRFSKPRKRGTRNDNDKVVSDAILSTRFREEREEEKRRLALEFLKIGITFEQVSKAKGWDIEILKELKNAEG